LEGSFSQIPVVVHRAFDLVQATMLRPGFRQSAHLRLCPLFCHIIDINNYLNFIFENQNKYTHAKRINCGRKDLVLVAKIIIKYTDSSIFHCESKETFARLVLSATAKLLALTVKEAFYGLKAEIHGPSKGFSVSFNF